MDSINDALAAILRTVQTPGDFFAAGECALHVPLIEVEGIGPVSCESHPVGATASDGRRHLNHSPRHFVERDALAVPHASSFNRIDISATMEELMGRKGTGVEIRGKAIRIQFSLNGEVVRRTLRRDGMAIPPSAENPPPRVRVVVTVFPLSQKRKREGGK